MAENMNHNKSTTSTSSSSDDGGWELEYTGGRNIDEVLAKLVARMDALEAENKLLKEKNGLIFAEIYFQ
jgi:hypothetical protein